MYTFNRWLNEAKKKDVPREVSDAEEAEDVCQQTSSGQIAGSLSPAVTDPEHAKVEKERKARVVAHFKASFGKGRAIR